MVEQLTPDQPVSGSIPLVLTFLSYLSFITYYLYLFLSLPLRALIAQSVEHGANNARVVGSSPTGSIFCVVLFLFFDFMLIFYSLYITGDLAQW